MLTSRSSAFRRVIPTTRTKKKEKRSLHRSIFASWISIQVDSRAVRNLWGAGCCGREPSAAAGSGLEILCFRRAGRVGGLESNWESNQVKEECLLCKIRNALLSLLSLAFEMITSAHEQDAKTEEKENNNKDSTYHHQQNRAESKQIGLAALLDNTPLLEKEVDLEEEKEDVISRPRASSNLSIQIFHKSTTTTAYTIHRSPRPFAFGHRRHPNPLLSMHINQMLSLKRRYERWPGRSPLVYPSCHAVRQLNDSCCLCFDR